jgi:branched-chain amino acid transport system permease protein
VFGSFLALMMYRAGMPLPIVILLACAAGALIGMFVERTVYRPVRFANRIVPMITALGVAQILRTASQVIWGTETLPFFSIGKHTTLRIGEFKIFSQQLIVIGISLVSMILFTLVIKKTKIGKATQCVMQDINLSQVIGIKVNNVIPLVYALGGFMGVLGGIVYDSYYNAISFDMGLMGTMKAWAAAMLGGVGSFYGAFLGGIILGLGESLASAYIGNAYRDALGYILIAVILLFKPTGLFGKQRTEKV